MWVVWGEKRNVSDTLRAEGYEVRTARRGSEAMIRVAESLPDLIISDIRMPGMDGYALMRNLRAAPRTRLVPIVFLTANKLEAELDRAEIVDRKNIPADVITMRSKVRLKDLVSGESNTYALVFPTEAKFSRRKDFCSGADWYRHPWLQTGRHH